MCSITAHRTGQKMTSESRLTLFSSFPSTRTSATKIILYNATPACTIQWLYEHAPCAKSFNAFLFLILVLFLCLLYAAMRPRQFLDVILLLVFLGLGGKTFQAYAVILFIILYYKLFPL